MASMATTLSPKLLSDSLFDSSFNGAPLVSPHSLRLHPLKASAKLSVSASFLLFDVQNFKFDPIKESIVSREMTRGYMMDMITHVDTDVVVVNAGSSGLSCAYKLSKNPSVQIVIIEQSVSPGDALGSAVSSFSPW